jgi:hypothetical protein
MSRIPFSIILLTSQILLGSSFFSASDELDPDELDPDELDPDELDPDELDPDELDPDELDPDELDSGKDAEVSFL